MSKDDSLYDNYTIKKSFEKALKAVENSVKAGWDTEKLRWHPHESLEGGTPTIAYGCKLKDSEIESGLIELRDGSFLSLTEGLTEKEADVLFKNALDKAKARAEYQWNNFAAVDVPFDELTTKYQLVLTNLVYNVGGLTRYSKWTWPKLRDAMLAKDDKEVRKQMVTSYKDGHTGLRITLDKRRDDIADSLGIV